jgi:predicted ATPase/class 3 adenylate cyclase
MKFSEVVAQTIAWLQREERVSYRALKREFDLDDETLEDLKAELIEVKETAFDKDGKMLVWVGASPVPSSEFQVPSFPQHSDASHSTLHASRAEAERRQLTVMFCDLVGSTALSTQLDPEDLRAVVRQYQQTCAAVIQRHEGYIAQYLGDGILVYFGYPVAHEDDARRAVRAGLEIIHALRSQVPSPLVGEPPFSPSPFQGEGSTSHASAGEGSEAARSSDTPHPNPLPQGAKALVGTLPRGGELQVRIGIHSGLVVIGDIGGSGRVEHLALGETPNIAARIQGLAEPNTVIVSAATQRLIEGQFESQPFGSHLLKGIATPISVYHVQSERQSASPLAGRSTLTPLVGRDQEVGLLVDRWEQAKEGRGQVVLLSGEPGIGKSRLAYTLRSHVTAEGSLLFEARCSPYHQHSALYPLIDALQRTLLLTRQDTESEKIAKLEQALALYNLQESLPLFTALLSLPTPAQYPAPVLTPQKQKERTLQALFQLLVAQADRQATVSVWEDLHWADPSSLEFLSLLIEQIPTTKLLLVLTFRPEFTPPWKPRSHISQLVLNRLGRKQVEAMIEKVAENKDLPAEVIEQIRLKTDGVPLFVEELTKTVLESVESIESVGSPHHTPLQLAIPATLQEALLARLDRLSEARQIAQLGATLGREFSHELIQAVAPLNEEDLHSALEKLVEAEILYQRGIGEQARYFFKHALIQDTAYQSLLKSTRQQYHQKIAQVLENHFPDTKKTQPELLAHHYTEASLIEQAIPYWQQAGQRAVERSANAEAISYLTKGLEGLESLPETSERVQQELILRRAIGAPLIATKGYTSEEVQNTYRRVRHLCERLENAPQLFSSLWGLALYYTNTGDNDTSYKLSQECLQIAQREHDSTLLVLAHSMLGGVIHWFGRFAESQTHLKQAMELYDLQKHRSLAVLYGIDPGVVSLGYTSLNLWLLGYLEQARAKAYETLALARKLEHPFCHAFALSYIALIHLLRREGSLAYQAATELRALAHEQGFQHYVGLGTLLQGFGMADGEKKEEGLHYILEGRRILKTLGTAGGRSIGLTFLLEVHMKRGSIEEGLNLTKTWFATADTNSDYQAEAEVYRMKGELLLTQEIKGQKAKLGIGNWELGSGPLPPLSPNPQSQIPDPESEAEACFLKAIDIARQQQAKSWELRASTSLARLWQRQGKSTEAHKLLSAVYHWFTEGHDTKDLQEAKALIEELSH